MSIVDHSLRNLTVDDFIFGSASQAANFWLIAYQAFQYITSDDDRRVAINRELLRQYPDSKISGTLGTAATNSSVTDAVRQFLPAEYGVASDTWLCGQLQTRGIAPYLLNCVSEMAKGELCHDITIDESLLALGTLPTMIVYALIFTLAVTAVVVYLIHAVKNGPRRTWPESVSDSDEAKAKKLGIEPLTSQAISVPPLQYPLHFYNLADAWLLTLGFLLIYAMFWFIFNNPSTSLVYNVAFSNLATRTAVATVSCLMPLGFKFFQLPSFVKSQSSAWLIWCYGCVIALTDLYMVLAVQEIVDQQNLFYRDRPCAGMYIAGSLRWTMFLIGLRWEVLFGMSMLYALVCWIPPKVLPRLKSKDYQKVQSKLARIWSLVHPFKIWVVIEVISLAQGVASGWWIRKSVVEGGLYANFHSSKFNSYVFMIILLCILAGEVVVLLWMDLRARWSQMVVWAKVQDTVDGSDEVHEIELDDLALSKS